jgi:hypothetical protein
MQLDLIGSEYVSVVMKFGISESISIRILHNGEAQRPSA